MTAQLTLTGKIIDDYTSAPMDGAKIKVKGLNAGAFTDDKGSFTINRLDFGVGESSFVMGDDVSVKLTLNTTKK